MNPDEMVFRLIAATILVMVGLTRDGVRFYIYLRQRPRRLPVEILRESLENVRNTADDLMATTPMALLALACFGGIGVFIFAPEKIAWSSVALPDWARFVGAAVALSGALGEMWALLYLGRQYSGLLRVRWDHMLIRQGPYAWVRHPMYSFGMPFLLGLGFLAANWFVILSGVAAVTLVMLLRTPREEALMRKAFGHSYKMYARRTGRFLPRRRTG